MEIKKGKEPEKDNETNLSKGVLSFVMVCKWWKELEVDFALSSRSIALSSRSIVNGGLLELQIQISTYII